MIRKFARELMILLLVPTALVLPVGASAAQCPPGELLKPPVGYAVSTYPFRVLVADFNTDGVPDIAYTLNGSSSIGVQLGVGNGTFGGTVTYPVQSGNGHIIAVDLNRDGHLDLATNSSGNDKITILPGRGDGTFDSAVTATAGDAPYGIVSADFNGDGIPDLASADFLANSVGVMFGLPAGGYASPVGYAVGTHPYDLQTGDFNEDGIADLVVTNQDSQNISVLIGHGTAGQGDGTFATAVNYPVQLYPYSVAIADLNNDGIADLAVANGGAGTVSILLGHGTAGVGDGTFQPGSSYSGGQPRQVVVADVDEDGIKDLVVADYYGSVDVLRGQGSGGVGNGSFATPQAFPAGSTVTGIALGDFDADTSVDVVACNYEGQSVSVLLHGCNTPPPPPPTPAPTIVDVRDVPNDQGGRVFVTWLRSGLDGGTSPSITGYRVWRRIPPEAAALATFARAEASPALSSVWIRNEASPEGTTVTFWEALVTLPAEQLEGYGYTAPTTQDSMENSNPYTAFFITALTSNPNVFYQSRVDSGYSVDNFPPSQPSGFTAIMGTSGVSLQWASNREADLDAYRLYRGTTPSFVPGPGNLVTTMEDTVTVDGGGTAGTFYKLAAIDKHGNQGPVAKATPAPPTGRELGSAVAFALRGAMPNPARDGRFTISYSLASSAPARLEVIDLAGRRVVDESVGALGSGPHTLELGRHARLPDGVYVVRLAQSGRALSAKVVVMK